MADKTRVKSAAAVERGRRTMATLERDAKGRLLKKTPALHPATDPPAPEADPQPRAPGGDAPAPDPFRGRILGRVRRRSS